VLVTAYRPDPKTVEKNISGEKKLMENLRKRQQVKYLHEGNYVAEVKIELIDSDTGWSPTMSLDTAYLLDDIREALRHGDLIRAAKNATIYEMKQIAI